MAVVTNIDAEHLDTYSGIEDIKDTFKGFLARLPFYGKACVCIDDPHVRAILPLAHVPTLRYGFSEDADLQACNVVLESAASTFDVYRHVCKPGSLEKVSQFLGAVTLSTPGRHNVSNSLAAIAIALEFDIPFDVITQSLATFKGVERRFEYKGMFQGAEIFDDYGHHPTEIQATLRVAQRRAQKDLHVIFQPHRFTRTQKLWEEFIDAFSVQKEGDPVIKTLLITDIYPASEDPIPGISSEFLVAAIQQKNPNLCVTYVSSYDGLARAAKNFLQAGDLLLTIGAGRVNLVAETLAKQ
jgi:UDP-N-acetylmuramate--alanine ligase